MLIRMYYSLGLKIFGTDIARIESGKNTNKCGHLLDLSSTGFIGVMGCHCV